MIKDCIFYSTNIPEELREILRRSSILYPTGVTSGVSCNYVNGQYINIIGIHDFNTQKLNENRSLMSIIGRIKPESLFEMALCINLYNDLLFHKIGHEMSPKEEKDFHILFFEKFKLIEKYKVISSLLMDSRGWIVWRYQLFNILSLAVDSHEKINAYIKGLNAKKADVIEELQSLKIYDFCVYDAIKELTPPTSSMTYGYLQLRDSLIINTELKLF